MKRFALCLFSVLLAVCLSGCLPGKKTEQRNDRDRIEQPEEVMVTEAYKAYLEEVAKQRPLFLAAVESQNPAAPISVLPAAIAAPAGSVFPLGTLRTIVLRYPDVELQAALPKPKTEVEQEMDKAQKEVDKEPPKE
jgi:hypothetical protein